MTFKAQGSAWLAVKDPPQDRRGSGSRASRTRRRGRCHLRWFLPKRILCSGNGVVPGYMCTYIIYKCMGICVYVYTYTRAHSRALSLSIYIHVYMFVGIHRYTYPSSNLSIYARKFPAVAGYVGTDVIYTYIKNLHMCIHIQLYMHMCVGIQNDMHAYRGRCISI